MCIQSLVLSKCASGSSFGFSENLGLNKTNLLPWVLVVQAVWVLEILEVLLAVVGVVMALVTIAAVPPFHLVGVVVVVLLHDPLWSFLIQYIPFC